MQWSPRQARYTLLLFLVIFAAGQVKVYLTRPVYPDSSVISDIWPPEGKLVDATVLENMALEVFPAGTTVGAAIKAMGLIPGPTGSGHCLPRAGILGKGPDGWSIRPMTQRERWVWRIPMDLYRSEPDDLQRIKGIGPTLARRIHRYVQGRGALKSLSELDEVAGVGPGKLEALEEELEIP